MSPSCLAVIILTSLFRFSFSEITLEAFNGDEIDGGQLQLLVEHSLDEGDTWQSRGTLTVHSLRTASTSFQQNPLSPRDKSSLEALCSAKGLYLLRIRAQQSGKSEPTIHRAVTDACQILQSGLRDVVTLHLDWRSQLVGVSVTVPPSSLVENAAASSTEGFKTQVSVQQMEAGPQPDTAAFIQKIEQEKLAKQRGETPDNRSFFAKYWMYIVPVVIVLAMNSAGSDATGGGR